MTSEQFAYWLQGFGELNAGPPTAEQWQSIRDHLAAVFTKVTPPAAPQISPLEQRGRVPRNSHGALLC